jgi:hypothetical protein
VSAVQRTCRQLRPQLAHPCLTSAAARSLKRERAVIDSRVTRGLLTGAVAAPRHGPVRRWLSKARRAADAAAQRAAAAAERRAEAAAARRTKREAVADGWGSALAAAGPEAGRRFFIDYKDRTTTWDPPAAVRRALREEREARGAARLRGAARESELFEEGLQAGAAAATAGRPAAAETGAGRMQRLEARVAVDRFLEGKVRRRLRRRRPALARACAQRKSKLVFPLSYLPLPPPRAPTSSPSLPFPSSSPLPHHRFLSHPSTPFLPPPVCLCPAPSLPTRPGPRSARSCASCVRL